RVSPVSFRASPRNFQMMLPSRIRVAFPMFVAGLFAGLVAATPASAQATLDKGDTAWMLISTVLVLLMIVPGLALFYGGLIRAKNLLSVLSQVLAITCLVSIIWVIYGYSLAFTGESGLIGGFSKAFLSGITP